MLQGVTVATKTSQKDPRGPQFRDMIKGEMEVIESHTEDSLHSEALLPAVICTTERFNHKLQT